MIGRRSVLIAFGLLVTISMALPAGAQKKLAPGADLRGADLQGADLSGARLAGANLTGASLVDAPLNNANLTGAKSDSTTTWPFADDEFWGNTTCPDGTLNSGHSPCTAEQLLLA